MLASIHSRSMSFIFSKATVGFMLLFLFCLVTGLMATWASYGRNIDDAYITYRYAENIASGNGYVYNIGEKIQGTTTPLYTIILAGARLLGADLPEYSTNLNVACAVASCLLIFLLVKKLAGTLAAILASALLAFDPFFIALSTSGMETNLYVVLILLSYLAYSLGRIRLAFIVAALCLLMRLDGAFVFVSLLVGEIFKFRRLPISPAVLFLLVILPWFTFATYYFGSPLPLSMIAKRGHSSLSELWMLKTFINRPYVFQLPFFIGGLFVPFFVRKKRYEIFALFTGFIVYVASYIFVGIPEYPWYKVPGIPIFHAIASIGAVALIRTIHDRFAFRGWSGNALLGVLTLMICFVWLYQARYTFRLIPATREQHRETELAREEASIWIRDNTETNAVIASDGIGYIGFYSKREIVDLAGLVTPEAIGKARIDVLKEFRPDYVLIVSPPGAFGSEVFSSDYILLKSWTRGAQYIGPHILWARID